MSLISSGASRTGSRFNITRSFNRTSALLISSTLALLACDSPAVPVAGPIAMEPRLAVVTNPRATFTYFDQAGEPRDSGFVSGYITGDRRDGTGLPLVGSSVYDDGRCGVSAQVFAGASGDATMDPIASRMSGCNNSVRRSVTLSYGTPIVGAAGSNVTAGHFTNVREVEQLPYVLGGNNVAERRFRLQTRGTTPCSYVRYGTLVGSTHTEFTVWIGGMPVTSKPARVEAVGPNTWIASSQPNDQGKHVALCEVVTNKGTTYTAAYDIPFRVQVIMKSGS